MSTNYLRENIQTLAEAIVDRQYLGDPQTWKPLGSVGRSKSVRDTRYHIEYLIEALEADSPELFLSYLEWVKVLFSGLGFSESVLPTTLRLTRQALEEQLPLEERLPALHLLDQGLASLRDMADMVPSFLNDVTPLGVLAQKYLKALLTGDRATASRMILGAVEDGVPLQDIYLQIFELTQHEIGRLWQTNQISVAQEHYCTAATQAIMSQLYPRLFETEKKGHSLVATCVGGELHEIGVRMIADLFELNGWDTHYLGANMPTSSILQMVTDRRAHVLAISTTMTFHLEQMRQVVAETRKSGLDVRILVGGYPFNLAPRLWESIGADGYAANAREALHIAERMLKK